MPKHHARTIDKMHLLIRLELANPLLNTTEIAKLAGVPLGRYATFKKQPLYIQLHNQYLTGVITRLDKKVDHNLNLTQETLKFAVPIAMQAILKQAMQEKDLRIQNKACNDILDRDGHFAKVSRIGLATKDQGGAVAVEDKDNTVAQELIAALAANKSPNISTAVAASTLPPSMPPSAPSIDSPPITEATQ
jgi:hypothetical protein